MGEAASLLVCETMKGQAPGVPYSALDLIGLKLTERGKKMVPMEFHYTEEKVGRSIEGRWTTTAQASAAAKKAA